MIDGLYGEKRIAKDGTPLPRTLSLVRKHEPGYGSPNICDVSEILPES